MKYRARADGFVDSHYVCEGEIFEYDGKTPSWATPIEEPKSAKPEETGEAVATPPPASTKKKTKK